MTSTHTAAEKAEQLIAAANALLSQAPDKVATGSTRFTDYEFNEKDRARLGTFRSITKAPPTQRVGAYCVLHVDTTAGRKLIKARYAPGSANATPARPIPAASSAAD